MPFRMVLITIFMILHVLYMRPAEMEPNLIKPFQTFLVVLSAIFSKASSCVFVEFSLSVAPSSRQFMTPFSPRALYAS